AAASAWRERLRRATMRHPRPRSRRSGRAQRRKSLESRSARLVYVRTTQARPARFNHVSRLARVGEEQRLGYEEMLARSRAEFDAVPDFTVAVEEEFSLLDPDSLGLINRF